MSMWDVVNHTLTTIGVGYNVLTGATPSNNNKPIEKFQGTATVGGNCGQGKYYKNWAPLSIPDTCYNCIPGTYMASSSHRNTKCTDCPPGTTTSNPGATSVSQCVQCQPGTFYSDTTIRGTRTRTCVVCPPGKFSNTAGATSCTNCAAGSYAPGSGSQSCTPCPANSVSSAGSSSCTVCVLPKFANDNKTLCTGCPAGKFYTAIGSQGPRCENCPAGRTSPAESTGISSCTACPAHHSSTAGSSTCTPCAANERSVSGGLCATCPAGQTLRASDRTCQNCPANHSSTAGGTCTACPAHHSSTAGSSTCTPCAANERSASGNSCTTCPAGQALRASDRTCENCPANHFSTAGGTCTPCTAGQTSTAGSSVCTACPAGQTSTAGGPCGCPAGRYLSGTTCTPCPAGTYSPTFGATSSSTCIPVNSGYYTNLPGATSQKICNAGYYCPPASLQTQPASSQTQPASSQTQPASSQTQPDSSQRQPASSQRQQPDVPEYDNGKIYKVNDMVKKDGIVYKMIDGIGAPGYPPPRPTNWQAQGPAQPATSQAQPASSQAQLVIPEYDNRKIYKVNDFVKKGGIVYKMIDGIGAPGYPPPRPTNWQQKSLNVADYDNGKVYKLNDVVKKDGIVYRMIDGIGAAGYPPPRPNNWRAEDPVISQVEAFTSQAQHVDVPEYESRAYNAGDYVRKDGIIYKAKVSTSQYTPPPYGLYWEVLQPPSPQTQSGATQRIPCAKGTYSVEYATACTACPQGTSTASTLSTSQSQCFAVYNSGSGSTVIPAQCPQGYSCDGITRTLCAPGTYSPAGQPTCRLCPSGTWSQQGAGVCTTISSGYFGLGSGLTSQTICPAGYRCPTTTAQPIACSAGSYSPVGQLTCSSCPTGTHTIGTASTSASDCIATNNCPAGYYCTSASGRRLCPATFACGPATDAAPTLTHNACPAGFYCLEGTTNQVYSSSDGSGSGSSPVRGRIPCQPGKECVRGLAMEVPCPAGTYCPEAKTKRGLDCPLGKYCPVGSINPTDCPIGNYCNPRSSTPGICPSGFYCPNPSTKILVGANEVCVKKESILTRGSGQRWGIDDLKVCSTGEIAVSVCPDGYYKSGNFCVLCPPGTTCLGGIRTQCPIGATATDYGSRECTSCEQGKVADTVGGTSCRECPDAIFPAQRLGLVYKFGYSFDGKTCIYLPVAVKDPAWRNNQINFCKIGTYRTSSGCDPCPAGQAGYPIPAKLIEDFAGGLDSETYYENLKCMVCPAGTYTTKAGSPACFPVQPGYYSNAGATSQTKCPRGYYCNDGTGPKACPAGTYMDLEGSASCKPASPGYYSPGTTASTPATAPIRCPRMSFSNSNQSSSCSPCTAGQYSHEGATACISCPTGTQYDSNAMQCVATTGTIDSYTTPNTRAVLLRNSGTSLTTLTVGTSRLRCMINGSYTSTFTLQKITYNGTNNTLYGPGRTPLPSTGTSSTNCEVVV
jgi:hypothetical protein